MLPVKILPFVSCCSLAARLVLCSLGAGLLVSAPSHAAEPRAVPQAAPDLNESQSLLGSYLAGRVARFLRDNDNAASYYQRALRKDPANKSILDDAFQLELASGNFTRAAALARQLIRRERGHRIARIFLGLDAYKQGDFARAKANFLIAENGSPGEPTVTLAMAWIAAAQGQTDRALASLDALNKTEWAAQFAAVHKAFIADVGRRKAVAGQAYKRVFEKRPSNTRIAEAYSRHAAFWGNRQLASEILTEKSASATPMGQALMQELREGKTPKLMVSTLNEGMAEVFLGIGQILISNNGVDAAQIYLRLAAFLDPASQVIQLELAEVYGRMDRYEKAIAVIEQIPQVSPLWLNARQRKAVLLSALEKTDQGIALLKELEKKYPRETQIPQTIASLEAGRKNFEAAIPYYTKAIGLTGKPEKKNWELFYARGIAYERTKQWPQAEADFRKALELDADQSSVLNYLGYSLLDRGMNLPEAMEMIKKAVSLKPNDGYIVDSLGWAYYLMGDYQQSLKYMEKAVEIRPEDPTLNDHLGDVYWRIGRKLEAQFQWSHALSLNPEPEDAVKIKKKLESGLQDGAGTSTSAELISGSSAQAREQNPERK